MSTERIRAPEWFVAGFTGGYRYLGQKFSVFKGDRIGQAGLLMLGIVVFLGIFAKPIIISFADITVTLQPFSLAPYEPSTRHRFPDDTLMRLEGPSMAHPLGTTHLGRDVLSQVIVGARTSLIVGSLAAFMAVFIGTNVGLNAAFHGGRVDDILMRITDIVYGLPFLPFAIVLVAIMGQSLFWIVFAIVIILWRSTARVIRSQVLSHKNRPYVESAEAIGASKARIMYIHILPNVLPLAFLYAAFAVGHAVIAEASLSFLGFGPPGMVSWGGMIHTAFSQDAIRQAYWWVFPPGIMIMMFVMSVFFIGRTLERVINPELRHRE